jgi:hypothetical protein
LRAEIAAVVPAGYLPANSIQFPYTNLATQVSDNPTAATIVENSFSLNILSDSSSKFSKEFSPRIIFIHLMYGSEE